MLKRIYYFLASHLGTFRALESLTELRATEWDRVYSVIPSSTTQLSMPQKHTLHKECPVTLYHTRKRLGAYLLYTSLPLRLELFALLLLLSAKNLLFA